jgi:hypothetical protein
MIVKTVGKQLKFCWACTEEAIATWALTFEQLLETLNTFLPRCMACKVKLAAERPTMEWNGEHWACPKGHTKRVLRQTCWPVRSFARKKKKD